MVKEGQTERYKVVVADNLNVMIDYANRATGGVSQQEVGIQKKICQLLTEWGCRRVTKEELNWFTYHHLWKGESRLRVNYVLVDKKAHGGKVETDKRNGLERYQAPGSRT